LRFKTIKLAGVQIPEAKNYIARLNPNLPFDAPPTGTDILLGSQTTSYAIAANTSHNELSADRNRDLRPAPAAEHRSTCAGNRRRNSRWREQQALIGVPRL
jgi:hypothetical protein